MTPSLLGIAGIVIFSVWFLLTVIFQGHSRVSALITRFDRFTLIPRWSFFSPDPGASNYHFLYRSRDESTTESDWAEVNLSPRNPFYAIWNPRKRYRECMIELFQLLALFRSDNPLEQLQFTEPYIILLTVARSHLDSSLSSDAFYQFALVESRGAGGSSTPSVRFQSLTHPVS